MHETKEMKISSCQPLCFFKDLKNDEEFLDPYYLKGKILGPVVIDKPKEMRFIDENKN